MMNKQEIIEVLEKGNIEWRRHSLERMLQRGISREEVKDAIKYGEIIENYENDTPFESALFFYNKFQAIHIVVALDKKSDTIYIITVYRPDRVHFNKDLKTRRK